MKKFLLLVILTFTIGYLFSAGGSKFQYVVITSSGITPITFNRNSTEIYCIKLSTMEAYINWGSTAMPMIAYTTNYFLLPETSSEFVYEHTEEVVNYKMSVYQPLVPGTTNNIHIRLQIKSW